MKKFYPLIRTAEFPRNFIETLRQETDIDNIQSYKQWAIKIVFYIYFYCCEELGNIISFIFPNVVCLLDLANDFLLPIRKSEQLKSMYRAQGLKAI